MQHYLIIDFEATCCNRGSIPRHQMEIIEIGAVMVDAQTLQLIDEFQSFIKPVRHSKLTTFCTELTSITQQQVDKANSFKNFIDPFKTWLNQYKDFAFCSWGDYDFNQLNQDCQYHQVTNPITAKHINIKRLMAEKQHLRKQPGLGQALRLANLEFIGTAHRGIDDARNMVRLLPYIFGEKKLP